jgi:chemotaxis protein histidine kinase CheA
VELAKLPPAIRVPEPPQSLNEHWQREWFQFWASDSAKAVVREALPGIVRLFELRQDRDLLRDMCRETPTTRGSKGQLIPNRLWSTVQAMEREIDGLEDRYGLNTRARLAIGASIVDTAKSLDDLNRRDDGDSDADEAPLALATDSD